MQDNVIMMESKPHTIKEGLERIESRRKRDFDMETEELLPAIREATKIRVQRVRVRAVEMAFRERRVEDLEQKYRDLLYSCACGWCLCGMAVISLVLTIIGK